MKRSEVQVGSHFPLLMALILSLGAVASEASVWPHNAIFLSLFYIFAVLLRANWIIPLLIKSVPPAENIDVVYRGESLPSYLIELAHKKWFMKLESREFRLREQLIQFGPSILCMIFLFTSSHLKPTGTALLHAVALFFIGKIITSSQWIFPLTVNAIAVVFALLNKEVSSVFFILVYCGFLIFCLLHFRIRRMPHLNLVTANLQLRSTFKVACSIGLLAILIHHLLPDPKKLTLDDRVRSTLNSVTKAIENASEDIVKSLPPSHTERFSEAGNQKKGVHRLDSRQGVPVEKLTGKFANQGSGNLEMNSKLGSGQSGGQSGSKSQSNDFGKGNPKSESTSPTSQGGGEHDAGMAKSSNEDAKERSGEGSIEEGKLGAQSTTKKLAEKAREESRSQGAGEESSSQGREAWENLKNMKREELAEKGKLVEQQNSAGAQQNSRISESGMSKSPEILRSSGKDPTAISDSKPSLGSSAATNTNSPVELPKQEKPKPEIPKPETDFTDFFKLLLFIIIAVMVWQMILLLTKHQAQSEEQKQEEEAKVLQNSIAKELKALEHFRLSPGDEVLRRYYVFLNMMKLIQMERPEYLPPVEYETELIAQLQSQNVQVRELTLQFCRVLYGHKEVSHQSLNAVRGEFKRLELFFVRARSKMDISA